MSTQSCPKEFFSLIPYHLGWSISDIEDITHNQDDESLGTDVDSDV